MSYYPNIINFRNIAPEPELEEETESETEYETESETEFEEENESNYVTKYNHLQKIIENNVVLVKLVDDLVKIKRDIRDRIKKDINKNKEEIKRLELIKESREKEREKRRGGTLLSLSAKQRANKKYYEKNKDKYKKAIEQHSGRRALRKDQLAIRY